LFDLEKDPHEMKDVYTDSACRQTVKEMKTELANLRDQHGDHHDCGTALGMP